MLWTATPSVPVGFVEFYVNNQLVQTVSAAPYTINLDTTTIGASPQAFLGIRALTADNRTYGYAQIPVTNANGGPPPLVSQLQSTGKEGSAVTSLSTSFTNANTAGNMIIAFVRMSSANQTVTLSDSQGNAYTRAVSQTQSADGHQIHIFYAPNIKGGSNAVTATFSSTNNHPFLAIYEYAGLRALDKTASAQGLSTTPATSSVTTATANELVFAAAGFPNSYGGAVSAGNGFNVEQQNTATARSVTEDAITNTSGTFAGNFSLSSSTNWSAAIATFTTSTVQQPPTITTTFLPAASVGVAYTATLGATTSVTWAISAGSLPAGLSLNTNTGVISGTPAAWGRSNFTVQATGADGGTASVGLKIAAIGLMQSVSGQGTGVASLTQTFGNGNAAGNLIIAFVRMSSSNQTVSITDTLGNTYVDAVSQVQNADGHQTHIFYAKNIVSGSGNGVTATFSGTNNHPFLAIFEYAGLSSTAPLDQVAAAQGNSSVFTATTPPLTSTTDLIFGGAGMPFSYVGTLTAPANFAIAQQNVGTSRGATEGQIASGVTSGVTTAASSFTAPTNTNWSSLVAAFK